MKTHTVHCLPIDCQNDFCHPNGTLFVPGADKDMIRFGDFINNNIRRIDRIHPTLDSHDDMDIAHPAFWLDQNANHPDPFTAISHQDIIDGKYRPSINSDEIRQHVLDYTKHLESNSQLTLFIWPVHCVVAEWGYCIADPVKEAFRNWRQKHLDKIYYVPKGNNPFTEHYGALQAEYVMNSDPSTKLNQNLIDLLASNEVDEVVLAGEASTHCVFTTLRQIVDNFGQDNAKKITVLEDCMSPVPGFDNLHQSFLDYCDQHKIKKTTSLKW